MERMKEFKELRGAKIIGVYFAKEGTLEETVWLELDNGKVLGGIDHEHGGTSLYILDIKELQADIADNS